MSTKVVVKKKMSLYPVNWVIVVALMFGFGFIPPVAPLTTDGMKVIGIFLGLIYGWTTAGLIWPSILGVLALPVNGLMTMNEAFVAGFGSNTFWLIAFLLILSAYIDAAELTKVMAMWFVTKRSLFGKPWLFSFVFLFATFILSATTHVMAAIVICWAILYKICGKLGYKPMDAYPSYMVLGIVLTGTLGTALLPFKPLPYGVLAAFTQMYNYTVGFGQYLLFSAVICLLIMISYVLVGKFILRIDVAKLKNLNESVFEPEDYDFKLTSQQKLAMGVLVAMVVLLLLPPILPASIPGVGFFKSIGLAGTVMLITALLVSIRVDGKPLLPFMAMANKGLQWPTLLLVGAITSVGSILTAESTGIQPFLVGVMMPLFEGKPIIIYVILLLILAVIITNYFNNAVAGVLLLSATTPISLGMGLSPAGMALLITFAIHLALISPAGSTMSAILFDNKEWITQKQIYKYALPNLAVMIVILIVVGFPLASFLCK